VVAVPSKCPGCAGDLLVTRLDCPSCETQVEGKFELPALVRLDPDDLEFVSAFVCASGSLKEMAAQKKQSYPTIRNRLDAIIASLRQVESRREEKRLAILEAIARRTITVDQGVKKLKQT
jgi:hypothetical protein